MPSEHRRPRWYKSVPALAAFCAVGWLTLISVLHLGINLDMDRRPTVKMGYMPVITNLASPLLDFASRQSGDIRFEALKFSSFAEMGEALRSRQIQAAFIIAPLSIVLHQQGAGVKVVYIGNRHESTLVYRKDLQVKDFSDLKKKTIAVPLRYSGHNICVHRLGEQFGFSREDLNIVEMNPPDMASAITAGALDAYFVGEPFAAQTRRSGASKVLYYAEQVWPNFICNLLLTTKEYIDNHPERVGLLVQGAARSGLWARSNTEETVKIASKYWNQPEELVRYALTTPPNRTVFDQFVPKQGEMQFLADQMVRFKLLESNNTEGLIEDRFAKDADLDGITDIKSIIAARSKK
ncbi:MAG: ABC transporter substrate-binding protein [Pseudomonadota bacterium]